MNESRDTVTIDDAFHGVLALLFVALMGTATLPPRDIPPLPDSAAVSLSESVHSARSVPDI
jgi:hypothetical protein